MMVVSQLPLGSECVSGSVRAAPKASCPALVETPFFVGLSNAERTYVLGRAAEVEERLLSFARHRARDVELQALRDVALLGAAATPDTPADELLPFAEHALWVRRFNQLIDANRDVSPRRFDDLCERLARVIRYERPFSAADSIGEQLFGVLCALGTCKNQAFVLPEFRRALDRELTAARILFTAARLARDTGHMLDGENFVREATFSTFHASSCLALLLSVGQPELELYFEGILPALVNAAAAVRLSSELFAEIQDGTLNILAFGWSPEEVERRVTEELAGCQHRLQVNLLAGAPERSIRAVRRFTVMMMQWSGLQSF